MSSIVDLLDRASDRHGERPALRWHGDTCTYADLEEAVASTASRLRDAGVESGDRVAVVAGNVPGAVVLLFALWRLKAVAVPVSDRLRHDDARAALAAADPAAVVHVAPGHAPAADGGRNGATFVCGPRAEDLTRLEAGDEPGEQGSVGALLLTTSGTSGPPKAVLVGHEREVEAAADLGGRLAIGPADRTALAVPLTHAFGLTCLLTALAAATEVVLVDSTTGPAPLLDALTESTIVHGSPTLFAGLSPEAARFDRLRTGFVAGATAPPGLLERLDEAGVTILNLYGMTEVGAATATQADDPDEVRWRTAGRALRGHELRVVDGELRVRGEHVSPGYFRQPDRTAAAFVDGWLRTGDLAELDGDGNLTIRGRVDDLVSVAGFNVAPAEVEHCLLEHEAVVGAVVVGRSDERLGNRLVAFVVPRDDSDVAPRDLLHHVRGRLAGYKVPYRVEFMDALPRLTTGKPDRRALARRAAETS